MSNLTVTSLPTTPVVAPAAPPVVVPTAPVLAPPRCRLRRDDTKTALGKIEFDRYVVTYYANKLTSCKTRGIAFNLTFTQVKNMLRAKKCQYTGIDLTHTVSGAPQRPTDVTIERINADLPYETGNVCAVSYAANQAKSCFDAQFGKNAVAMIQTMSKYLKNRAKTK